MTKSQTYSGLMRGLVQKLKITLGLERRPFVPLPARPRYFYPAEFYAVGELPAGHPDQTAPN